jgi:D-3-phosphoglycerate dehydrogenase
MSKIFKFDNLACSASDSTITTITITPSTLMSTKTVAASDIQQTSISLRDHMLHVRRRSAHDLPPRFLQPVENGGVRLLMLENISQEAVFAFRRLGFHVDHYTSAMSEDDLVQKIGSYHAIGIRSKTKITRRVIQAAPKVRLVCIAQRLSDVCLLFDAQLLVIGCFCIGTNQVDLKAAASAGIPVFNSPFSNSRSVAELVLAELIALSRQLFERAHELRNGIWNKQSKVAGKSVERPLAS